MPINIFFGINLASRRDCSMIKTIISDLGKVILFFDNKIFYTRISQFSPYSPERVAELVRLNFNLVQSFDKGEMSPHDFYKNVSDMLKVEIDYERFYEIYNDVFSLNSSVLEIYKKLKPRLRLMLCSNTDVMRFGFIKKRYPSILIFHEYILSYEVGWMKPHPQIYRAALKKAQAKAEECVFIDDLKENIEAAEILGIKGILFGPQTNLEESLRKVGVDL